mgnify:CR=1 FL=1
MALLPIRLMEAVVIFTNIGICIFFHDLVAKGLGCRSKDDGKNFKRIGFEIVFKTDEFGNSKNKIKEKEK